MLCPTAPQGTPEKFRHVADLVGALGLPADLLPPSPRLNKRSPDCPATQEPHPPPDPTECLVPEGELSILFLVPGNADPFPIKPRTKPTHIHPIAGNKVPNSKIRQIAIEPAGGLELDPELALLVRKQGALPAPKVLAEASRGEQSLSPDCHVSASKYWTICCCERFRSQVKGSEPHLKIPRQPLWRGALPIGIDRATDHRNLRVDIRKRIAYFLQPISGCHGIIVEERDDRRMRRAPARIPGRAQTRIRLVDHLQVR